MHEQHTFLEPDSNFDTGTLAHLVVGNTGRALDGRRTSGYIEQYDAESAMFVWRITAFEDSGKFWEVPAEQISSYQFRKDSALLPSSEVHQISERCNLLNQTLAIPKSQKANSETEEALVLWEDSARSWILQHSSFYKSDLPFDFQKREGNALLFTDLENYLNTLGLYQLEIETAEQYLINPYSGEWIKGMKIVMAEIGLIAFRGTQPRKKDTFLGIGAKENRKNYILARIAFLRSIFKLKGHTEVPLFRGMSSELAFFETPETLLSSTFSINTAMAFSEMQTEKVRSAYLVKFTCPVDNLFMTFFETKQFSQQYKEQEAVIFYDGQVKF